MKEFAETNGTNIKHYNLMETSISPKKKENDFNKSKNNNSKIITENTIISQDLNEDEEIIAGDNKMSLKKVILFVEKL